MWHIVEIEWMWDMFPGKYAQCRIFALLYGLTQKGQGWNGSVRQLAKTVRISYEGVRLVIEELKKKNLIEQKEGCIRTIYTPDNSVVTNDNSVVTSDNSVASPHTPLYNNINNNNPSLTLPKERTEKKEDDIFMKEDFNKFWELFAPDSEYNNRKHACQTKWDQMTTFAHACIMREFQIKGRDKIVGAEPNPYFYLHNWRPPTPNFLPPLKQHAAMLAGCEIAIVHVPQYDAERPYKALTAEEAKFFGFKVIRYMHMQKEN